MSVLNTTVPFNTLDTIFKKSSRIFFIGIGGASMASLAKYCLGEGKMVFGCDSRRTAVCQALEKSCYIKYYSSTDSVYGMDLVIYTTAIDESNFEYKRAKELNIPLISRANFLGYIISGYKNRIGICGMHGKSTVTSMLAHIFTCAKKEPCVFCGAEMGNYNSFEILTKGDSVIFEACEYLNAFHCLPATECAITNIDFDHPDFFSSTDEIIKSFQEFANMAQRVYLNADNIYSLSIKHENIITYGFENNSIYKGTFTHSPEDNSFRVYKNGEFIGECPLKLKGKHFAYDALLAYAVAYENGISSSAIGSAFEGFRGAKRRLEFIKKTSTGASIFEDYAHHPTEIKATLNALRDMGYKKILCIFQAHTYSRTYMLYEQFKSAFIDTDTLIITPIYSAREKNTFGFTDEEFALDCGGKYMDDFRKIAHHVSMLPVDAIVIMGAGDIGAIKGYF